MSLPVPVPYTLSGIAGYPGLIPQTQTPFKQPIGKLIKLMKAYLPLQAKTFFDTKLFP